MEPPKPYREERPWGGFIEFARNKPCTVKILNVKPNEALSLQKHTKRDEFWHVLKGDGAITKGQEQFAARAGEEFWIPRGTEHRILGGSQTLSVLEVSFGEFDDEDIERLEDKYGRTGS